MATKEELKKKRVTTPEFRVSFPNVWKPKAMGEGADSKPKYSVQMIFPKGTDLTEMKKFAHEVKVAEWGPDKSKWPKVRYPAFKDGNEKNLEGMKDSIIVEARTINKPGVVDRQRNEILDPSEFYAGCWARATVSCFAYNNKGNKGVSFGLLNLQKTRDDTAFSGRKNAKDDFDDLSELDIDEDNEGSGDSDELDADDF